VGLDRYGKC